MGSSSCFGERADEVGLTSRQVKSKKKLGSFLDRVISGAEIRSQSEETFGKDKSYFFLGSVRQGLNAK